MFPCFFLIIITITACRNDMEKVHLFDEKDVPQQLLDSVRAIQSSDGKMQVLLTTPAVTIYDKPERKTEYPQGVQLQVFDNGTLSANITADYAYSLDDQKTIEAQRNVIIIDFSTGDTFYLQSLVWNSSEHRIYSMEPVKSVNGQQVTYGDGFESDDNLKQPFILHQRGTLAIDDE